MDAVTARILLRQTWMRNGCMYCTYVCHVFPFGNGGGSRRYRTIVRSVGAISTALIEYWGIDSSVTNSLRMKSHFDDVCVCVCCAQYRTQISNKIFGRYFMLLALIFFYIHILFDGILRLFISDPRTCWNVVRFQFCETDRESSISDVSSKCVLTFCLDDAPCVGSNSKSYCRQPNEHAYLFVCYVESFRALWLCSGCKYAENSSNSNMNAISHSSHSDKRRLNENLVVNGVRGDCASHQSNSRWDSPKCARIYTRLSYVSVRETMLSAKLRTQISTYTIYMIYG